MFGLIAWTATETYREQLQQLENESRAMTATMLVYLQRGLDIRSVQTIIEEIPLPGDSVITITDANSVVLARSLEPARYVGHKVETAPRPIRDVPASEQRLGMDGIERVYTNAVFPAWPWLVSVGMATDVASRRVYPIVIR